MTERYLSLWAHFTMVPNHSTEHNEIESHDEFEFVYHALFSGVGEKSFTPRSPLFTARAPPPPFMEQVQVFPIVTKWIFLIGRLL